MIMRARESFVTALTNMLSADENLATNADLSLRAQLDLSWIGRALRDGEYNHPPENLAPTLSRCLDDPEEREALVEELVRLAIVAGPKVAPRALMALAEVLPATTVAPPVAFLSCLGGRRVHGVVQCEEAAMACIARCVATASVDGETKVAAPPPGAWVTARAPARVDLAGGWTDTPPICYDVGGCVVNLAVTVDGRKPIGARARRTPDAHVITLGTRLRAPREGDKPASGTLVLTSVNELECDDPTEPGALAKAVLRTLGAVSADARAPRLADQLEAAGGGIQLETWSELPHGSGLGTSSILAAAAVAAVATVLGRSLDASGLAHAVLQVEQRLTTGGGWQDQIGGIVGGAKLCTCAPQLPLRVSCEPLQLSDSLLTKLSAHLQLVFTGQVRLARNLLRDVLRRWLLGRPASVANIAALVDTAHSMAQALSAGDVPAVGQHLAAYWEQKKKMCDAEPERVAQMLDALFRKGVIHGGALAGAGGGGFLLVVTVRPHARAEVEEALSGGEPPLAEIVEVDVDREGLTLSVEGRPQVRL